MSTCHTFWKQDHRHLASHTSFWPCYVHLSHLLEARSSSPCQSYFVLAMLCPPVTPFGSKIIVTLPVILRFGHVMSTCHTFWKQDHRHLASHTSFWPCYVHLSHLL